MLMLENLVWGWPGAPEQKLSLAVEAGEIALVSGPSGCGKTSLLNCLAGFMQPHSGSASWQGADFLALPPWQRPVSFLFQSGNLFEHLSARRNIALAFVRRGEKPADADRQVTEAAARLGLEAGLLNRPVTELSGGQQQRVALARTMLVGQPVLLLDEPFSSFDEKLKHSAARTLTQLVADQQMACLVVSHDARDCQRLGVKKQIILSDHS